MANEGQRSPVVPLDLLEAPCWRLARPVQVTDYAMKNYGLTVSGAAKCTSANKPNVHVRFMVIKQGYAGVVLPNVNVKEILHGMHNDRSLDNV